MDVPLDLRVVAGQPRLYWNDRVIIDVSQPLFENPHVPFDVMLKRMPVPSRFASEVMKSFSVRVTWPLDHYFPIAHVQYLESIKRELHPTVSRFLEGGRPRDVESLVKYSITPHIAYTLGHDVRHFTFAARAVPEQHRLREVLQGPPQEIIGARKNMPRVVSPVERWKEQLFSHTVPPDIVLLDMPMKEFKETVFNRYRVWTDSSYWEKERARFLSQREGLEAILFDSNVPHFSERDKVMHLHWKEVVQRHKTAVEKYLRMDDLLKVVSSCNRFHYITGIEFKINPPPKDFIALTTSYWEESLSYFSSLASRIELTIEKRNYVTLLRRIPARIADIVSEKLYQVLERSMSTVVQFYSPVVSILTKMCREKTTYQEQVKLLVGNDAVFDFRLDENIEYAFGVWRSFILDPIRRYNSRVLSRFAPSLPKINLDSPVTMDDGPTGCILPDIPKTSKSRARLRSPSFDVEFLEKTSPTDLLLLARKILNDVFNGSDKIAYTEYKKFKELLSCTVYDQILALGENKFTARKLVSAYINCLDISTEEIAARLKLNKIDLMSSYWERLYVSDGVTYLGSDLFQTTPHDIEDLYPEWRKDLATLRGKRQRSSLNLTTIDNAYFKAVTPLDPNEKFQPNLDVYLKFEYPDESPGIASRRVHALLHSIYLWDALCLARETSGKQPSKFRAYAFTVRDLKNYSLAQITNYFKEKILRLANPSHPLHKYWNVERYSRPSTLIRPLPDVSIRLDWPFADKGSVALALCLHENYRKYKPYAKRRVVMVNSKGLSFFDAFLTNRIKAIEQENAALVFNALVDILQDAVANADGKNAFVFCMPFVHVLFWLHEKTYLASLKFPNEGAGTLLKKIYFSWLERKKDVELGIPSFGVEHPLICPYFI